MAIKKPNLSSVVKSQLPEFVREDYQSFIAFIEAYYDFLKQNYDVDLLQTRDIDNTLDDFIKHFKSEFGKDVPATLLNDRNLIPKLKDYYLAKGTSSSYTNLLALLYGKGVSIDYPGKQMLRASDGRWNQDVSVFAKINAGNPNDIVGRIVDVVTPTRIIRVQINKSQNVEIEVDRIRQVVPGIYELYIDRRFFGNVNIGDRLRYADTFDATILPTTAKIVIDRPGKGFKIGELYNITNGKGTGSVIKVSRVNDTGGILACEFVKYGIGYENDFTSTLLPDGLTQTSNAGATYLSIAGISPSWEVGFGETTDGFTEQGVINRSDYVAQTPSEASSQGSGLAWDGTYAGETVREFYSDNKFQVLDADVPALIRVTLGPLTKYPGYYTSNNGFLSDAIFIQDSRYYQAFSYVLKIDERLENYKSVVKTLIHPAGMAMFGEYDIRNTIDVGETIEVMLKYLVLTFQDNVILEEIINYRLFGKALGNSLLNDGVTTDFDHVTPVDPLGSTTLYTSKPLADHLLYDGLTTDINEITLSDFDGEDEDRTMPFFGVSKAVNSSVLYDGETLDDNTVPAIEPLHDYEYDGLTRLGITSNDITKLLDSTSATPHRLYGGVTLDNDTFSLSDTTGTNGARTMPYADIDKAIDTNLLYDNSTSDANVISLSDTTGEDDARTMPYMGLSKTVNNDTYLYDGETLDDNNVTPTTTRDDQIFDFGKLVNATLLYDGITLDDNTVAPIEDSYFYLGDIVYRNGISDITLSKTLDSTQYTHKLYDNATSDSDTFSLSDTTGTNGTRTMPYVEMEKELATHNLYDNATADANSVSLSDTTGTDSTRTMPYIVLNKSISAITLDYDGNLDDESVTVTAGGAVWLNPYTDPYPVASSYFLNDGGEYTEGESAFTG